MNVHIVSSVLRCDETKKFLLFFRLRFVWIEYDSADIVLIDSDGLSITFAEGCKQVKESFVF